MPKRAAKGIWAKNDVKVEARAAYLQGQAVARIKADFHSEDESLKLEGLAWKEFIRNRDNAYNEGRQDEFDESVAELLTPLIEQLISTWQQPQAEQEVA